MANEKEPDPMLVEQTETSGDEEMGTITYMLYDNFKELPVPKPTFMKEIFPNDFAISHMGKLVYTRQQFKDRDIFEYEKFNPRQVVAIPNLFTHPVQISAIHSHGQDLFVFMRSCDILGFRGDKYQMFLNRATPFGCGYVRGFTIFNDIGICTTVKSSVFTFALDWSNIVAIECKTFLGERSVKRFLPFVWNDMLGISRKTGIDFYCSNSGRLEYYNVLLHAPKITRVCTNGKFLYIADEDNNIQKLNDKFEILYELDLTLEITSLFSHRDSLYIGFCDGTITAFLEDKEEYVLIRRGILDGLMRDDIENADKITDLYTGKSKTNISSIFIANSRLATRFNTSLFFWTEPKDWTIQNHYDFSQTIRSNVRSAFMTWKEKKSSLARVPKDIIFVILRFVAADNNIFGFF